LYWPLEDGVVAAVIISTRGVDVQRDALAAATEKFGEPTKLETVAARTRAGVEFSYVDATWNRPGFKVRLWGADGSTGSGRLQIQTDEFDAAFARHLKAVRSSEPKM